jgi:hypothetical protein
MEVMKHGLVAGTAVDPFAIYDQDGGVKGQDTALASAFASELGVSEEEISPVLGDLVVIPSDGLSLNVPDATAIRFRNYSSTANLQPGKVYVEIYPNQESFDNREEGAPIYVEFNAFNIPNLLHSKDAVLRRELFSKLNAEYDPSRTGLNFQGQGTPSTPTPPQSTGTQGGTTWGDVMGGTD